MWAGARQLGFGWAVNPRAPLRDCGEDPERDSDNKEHEYERAAHRPQPVSRIDGELDQLEYASQAERHQNAVPLRGGRAHLSGTVACTRGPGRATQLKVEYRGSERRQRRHQDARDHSHGDPETGPDGGGG